jgi:hypothetical protein
MLLTPLGIVTLARFAHSSKANSPMLVTPSGIDMLARFLQAQKTPFSMLVIPSGIIKEVSAFPAGYATKVFLSLLYKTPLSEVYALLPEPAYIALRLAQLEKASVPMLVTLSGIDTLARLVQS